MRATKKTQLVLTCFFILSSLVLQAQNRDSWTPKSVPSVQAYLGFSVSIGEYGYVGLGTHDGTLTKQVWQFDPVQDKWTRKADFPGTARNHVASFTINGKAYVGMGWNINDSYNDLWEYDPDTDSWTEKASFPGIMKYVNAFSVDGKGYYACGYNGDYINHVWEYDPTADTWTRKADAPLIYAAPEAATFTIENRAYLVGGNYFGFGVDHVWEYNPENDTWVQKVNIPVGRNRAVGFTLGDKGFVAGGVGEVNGGSGEFDDVYEYNSIENTWTKRASFGDLRSGVRGFAINCKGYLLSSGSAGVGSAVGFSQYAAAFPQISIVAPDFICQGDTAMLVASGATTYQWNPVADLSHSHEAATEAFPSSTTTYSVVGTDLNGCSSVATTTLTLSLPIQVSNEFNPVCAGDSLALNVSGALTYSWLAENSSSLSDQSALMVKPLQNTFYTVTGIDEDGCHSVDTAWVDIITLPLSDFSFTSAGCQTDTTFINYLSALEDGLLLTWDVDGGQVVDNVRDSTLKVIWSDYGEVNISLMTTLNGCHSTSLKTEIIKKTPGNNFSMPDVICGDENAFIEYQGNAGEGAIFHWNFNGGEIVFGANAGPYEVRWPSFGEQLVNLSVTENGCSSEVRHRLIKSNQEPGVLLEAEKSVCYNANYQIRFVGHTYTDLAWEFDEASVVGGDGITEPYTLNWISSGDKSINIIVANDGCVKDTSVVVMVTPRPVVPEICMVTVGQETSKNEILWKYESASVSKFGVYKETNTSGEYELLDYVDMNGSTGVYTDETSTPDQRSNRYKISVVDTCGTETALSDYHKTIHLMINRGVGNSWNLFWDGYEGFMFSTYRIYRGTSNGSLELLTEISSNLTSYTDTDALNDNVHYQIELFSPFDCAPDTAGRTKAVTSSKSNVASNVLTAIQEVSTRPQVSPNPSTGIFEIQVKSLPKAGKYAVYNTIGQSIVSGSFEDGTFAVDLTDQTSGMFLLQIFTEKDQAAERLFKR